MVGQRERLISAFKTRSAATHLATAQRQTQVRGHRIQGRGMQPVAASPPPALLSHPESPSCQRTSVLASGDDKTADPTTPPVELPWDEPCCRGTGTPFAITK